MKKVETKTASKRSDATAKKSKNVSKVMAIVGWAIITLAVTFGGGMYAGHTLAQPTQVVQPGK